MARSSPPPPVATPRTTSGIVVDRVETEVFVIPTDRHESDGTIAWDKTTMVVAHVHAGAARGIGWTFAHKAAAELIAKPLASAVRGVDVMATSKAWMAMVEAIRNIGRPGLGWEAISAVDIALWDLKAKMFGVSLARLLGPARSSVEVYGSGGFTSYDDRTLATQLGGWAAAGFSAVKMKVGRQPARDLARVRVAREAIGNEVALFVDANGAWSRKQALAQAEAFAPLGVTWLEEPVSSEDLEGLRLLRDRAPAGMDIAAGEYGYVLDDFRRMLGADCIDVVQADATRCGGVTGFLAVAGLCEAFGLPMSAHCAPLLHAHIGSAIRPLRHLEYFHDHARIEHLLFEGALEPVKGRLTPDPDRPGLGVELRKQASNYA